VVSEIIVQLKGVSKYYDETPALSDVDLYIRKNEFVTLLGPSGCGKTTMLRLIGGFEKPDSGTITFEVQISRRSITQTQSEHRVSEVCPVLPSERF